MNNDIYDKLLNKINILDVVQEYVSLNKKGQNYFGLCPFHEDTNPSMSVSESKQIYKCFVCNNGGNSITFVANKEEISYRQAAIMLSKKFSIEINIADIEAPKSKYDESQQKIISVLKASNDKFKIELMLNENKKFLDYMIKKRKLSLELLEEFDIGLASNDLKDYLMNEMNFSKKENFELSIISKAGLLNKYGKPFFRDRIIFGIRNKFNDIVGFSARSISDDSAKYINSQDSNIFSKSKILYNFYRANEYSEKTQSFIITEGFMDVISLYKANIKNSIAIMGVALTKEHLKLLKNKKIILFLDSDNAGIQATLKYSVLLLENKLDVVIVNNQNEMDPDEILISKGIDELRKTIENTIKPAEFVIDKTLNKISDPSATEYSNYIKKIKKYFVGLTESELNFLSSRISDKFNVNIELVKKNLSVKKYTHQKFTQIAHEPNHTIHEHNFEPIPPKQPNMQNMDSHVRDNTATSYERLNSKILKYDKRLIYNLLSNQKIFIDFWSNSNNYEEITEEHNHKNYDNLKSKYKPLFIVDTRYREIYKYLFNKNMTNVVSSEEKNLKIINEIESDILNNRSSDIKIFNTVDDLEHVLSKHKKFIIKADKIMKRSLKK